MALSPTKTALEIFFDACNKQDLVTVRALISLGADVNWVDGDVESGLHSAVRGNCDGVLDVLLGQPGPGLTSI